MNSKNLSSKITHTLVLPCFNEALGVAGVVEKGLKLFDDLQIQGEVVVVDNGSTDESAKLAKASGARVVAESRQGYGYALQAGFAAATGQVLMMADADGSYDVGEFEELLRHHEQHGGLVLGNRYEHAMEVGATPWLHRYVGVPFLTGLLGALAGKKLVDAHSGMRVITKTEYERLHMRTGGMEYASEMILKAAQLDLAISEVPIHYRVRYGESKLATVRDGWRHLRFMLLYSPLQWFVWSGAAMMAFGLSLLILLLQGPMTVFGVTMYLHPMFVGSILVLMGYQVLFLGVFAHVYGVRMGLILRESEILLQLRRSFRLEVGLGLGIFLTLSGLLGLLYVVYVWWQAGFENIFEVRRALFGVTILMLGVQTLFSSVVLSMLNISVQDEVSYGKTR